MEEQQEQSIAQGHEQADRQDSGLSVKEEKPKIKPIVYIAAIVEGLLFGASFLGSKIALDSMTPLEVNAARWTVATVIFLILIATKVIKLDFRNKPIKYVLIIGFLEPCLYSICETWGIDLTTAAESSIVLAIMPAFVTVVSVIIFKTKVDRITWASIIIAFIGVIFTIVFSPDFSLGGKTIGFIFLIIAVVCGGSYTIMSEKQSSTFSVMEMTFIMSVMGCIWFNILAFASGQGVSTYTKMFSSTSTLFAVLYLGIMCSMICYMLYNYILGNMPAHKASIITMNLITVTGVLTGVIFRGEVLGWHSIVGMILILSGVVGANRKTTHKDER